MSDPVHGVEIERLRLTGLDVTPQRAERMRAIVEVELQRLLERGGWPEGLAGGEVPRLVAPTMHVDESHGDSRLASGLARNIFQSLRGVK
jgi:hypothetical protein